MIFRYGWDLIECKWWNWRLKCPFKVSLLMIWHFGTPFPCNLPKWNTFFFNWGSLHVRLNSNWKAWSYKKKRDKKIKAYRKPLQKEPTVNRCLLIPDLKPYPKTRTTFCIWGRPHWIRDGNLNTLGYFLFFWLLVYWTWVENLWTFQMPQILKKRCNFTLRWLLDMGNTSLEQKRLKTLNYLLFIPAVLLAVVWLLHG